LFGVVFDLLKTFLFCRWS